MSLVKGVQKIGLFKTFKFDANITYEHTVNKSEQMSGKKVEDSSVRCVVKEEK